MLPPGGEGEVKVTLTPKGNHQDILKRIVVVSNDPKQPRFTLTMKGKLLVDVRAEPGNLNLPDIKPGEPAALRFALRITDPATTTIESIEVEDQDNFTIHPLPAEAGVANYELRFRGSKTIGNFGTRVEVRTTGPHTPELNIPVRAAVASNLRYAKRMHFPLRDDAFLARQIRVSTRDGTAPQIKKVEDPAKLLVLEIREPVDGSVTIDARVDQAAYQALDEAQRKQPRTLTIHTNDPDEPRVEITYSLGTTTAGARVRPEPR